MRRRGGAAARIALRRGGRPIREYAVKLQVRVGGEWVAIRLIDNHLNRHHMHRYTRDRGKQDPEHFPTGTVNQAIPVAIEYFQSAYRSIIQSWTTS